jgi:hypothetical protein
MVSREPHSGDNICDAGALCDQHRPAVDRAVPDPPQLVVPRVVRAHQQAAKAGGELRCIDPGGLLHHQILHDC